MEEAEKTISFGMGAFVVYNKTDNKSKEILKAIKENEGLGTIELSKKVGMAPKNLIRRLKALISLGAIIKENKPSKPKGRQRIFKLTESAKAALETYKFVKNEMEANKEK